MKDTQHRKETTLRGTRLVVPRNRPPCCTRCCTAVYVLRICSLFRYRQPNDADLAESNVLGKLRPISVASKVVEPSTRCARGARRHSAGRDAQTSSLLDAEVSATCRPRGIRRIRILRVTSKVRHDF